MAGPVDSNLDDVAGWLDRLVAGFDFSVPGKDQSLGRDIAGAVVEGIQDRSVADGNDATGAAFMVNAPWYAKWKAKKYSALQPGILSGQMLSSASLMGETEVNADEIVMRYGTGDAGPDESSTGVKLKGTQPTDKEKAEWFTAGGRPFYALDGTIRAAVVTLAGDALDEHLKGG
jgi:hypothetical protein